MSEMRRGRLLSLLLGLALLCDSRAEHLPRRTVPASNEPAPADDMSKPKSAAADRKAARITVKMVEARYARARELADKGDRAGALAEYLWCFDEGMPAHARFTGVRVSFLLSEVARLGESYPLALEALRKRRDTLERTIVAEPEAVDALSDHASLNHYLKEDGRNLALFERLPPGDPRRGHLGLTVYRDLAKAGRYADALEAHSYDDMINLFEAITRRLTWPGFSKAEKADLEARHRVHAVRTATGDIEVLVGAGKLDEARAYAAKLLALDDSVATRKLLHEAATRAGHPELFTPEAGPK